MSQSTISLMKILRSWESLIFRKLWKRRLDKLGSRMRTFSRRLRISRMSLTESWMNWSTQDKMEQGSLTTWLDLKTWSMDISSLVLTRSISLQQKDLFPWKTQLGTTRRESRPKSTKATTLKLTASPQVNPTLSRPKEVSSITRSPKRSLSNSTANFWIKTSRNTPLREATKSRESSPRDQLSELSRKLRCLWSKNWRPTSVRNSMAISSML